MSVPVRTRFAPSPTGFLHVGGARTALFCWLQARATGGQFVLRIEDTDRERSTGESVQAILDGMAWLGLDYDEGPFYQSQRQSRYREVVDGLLESGHAYRCYCSKERIESVREAQKARGEKPRYDGHCRSLDALPEGVEPVIRFRNPDQGHVAFEDRVRGSIRVENSELDDLVILRADGTPTYNFAVVVDDLDMGITLVIRGDDHINNTPRQINIYRALGAEPPTFAHVPMILGDDGARLSKRHGAVSVMAWREKGYLPQALVNYLVRLGWSHGDQEVFDQETMIRLFSIDDVNRKPSAFNTEKLDWLNQHYLRTLPMEDLGPELEWHFRRAGLDPTDGPALEDLRSVQADRVDDLVDLVEQSRAFYGEIGEYEEKAARKHLRPVAEAVLADLSDRLKGVSEWLPPALEQAVAECMESCQVGMGKVGGPLRVALTGQGMSPSLDKTLWLTGRERTLERIERALDFIRQRAVAAD